VESGRRLSFIISKQWIHVDPLKIEAIVNLPPPSTLCQLQSLQGKENILHRFIPDYAEITKGFIHLLKKVFPFIWDDVAQKSFEAVKHALTHTSLLHPLIVVVTTFYTLLLRQYHCYGTSSIG
jgi:hypothetical protein